MKKLLHFLIILCLIISITACEININIPAKNKNTENEISNENIEKDNFDISTSLEKIYDNLTDSQNYTTAYTDEKKIGYADDIAEILPHPQGGSMLYPVYRKKAIIDWDYLYKYDKIGFINEKGQIVVEPKYSEFSYQYDENDKIKYIFTFGAENLEIYTMDGQLYMTADSGRYFSNLNGSYFYTYKYPMIAYEMTYELDLYNINTKEILISIKENENCNGINFLSNNLIVLNYIDKPSIIFDLTDPTLKPLNIENAYMINGKLENGLFAAADKNYGIDPITGGWTDDILYGYMNIQGEWIIEPQFTNASNFHNNIACVGFSDRESPKYYFVNEKMEIISEKAYDYFLNIVYVGNDVYYMVRLDETVYLLNDKLEELVTSNSYIGFEKNYYFIEYNYEKQDYVHILKVPNTKPFSPIYEWISTDYYQGYVNENGEWLYREKIYQYLDD